MRKIPTLLARNVDDRRYVIDEVVEECRWVVEGEGVATRKFDGVCVLFDGVRWWARREVRPGKKAPEGFVLLDRDAVTGKSVGWEPIEASPFYRWAAEAVSARAEWLPGTYELCGPRINGNREGFVSHALIAHGTAQRLSVPTSFDALARWLLAHPYEGVVWHHPDGRMAKIKRRDFAVFEPVPDPRPAATL